MLRRLHTSGVQLDGRFDIWEKINGFLDRLQGTDVSDFTGMQELHETICALYARLKGDVVPLCACHCDSYNPNFLINKQGKMYLIDWEYAGMADPGCDIGTFIACSDYTTEEAEQVIARYLGHAPTARSCATISAMWPWPPTSGSCGGCIRRRAPSTSASISTSGINTQNNTPGWRWSDMIKRRHLLETEDTGPRGGH